jgi:hypothetical protein
MAVLVAKGARHTGDSDEAALVRIMVAILMCFRRECRRMCRRWCLSFVLLLLLEKRTKKCGVLLLQSSIKS